MSEAWTIALTSISTIVGGIIVYTFGHLLVHLFVEPILHLRGLIGEIADSLVFYANLYGNPGMEGMKERYDAASETLRRQASQLMSKAQTIPWYSLWALAKLVPQKAKIKKASAALIGLSNSLHDKHRIEQNLKWREEIEQLLGIRVK